MYGLKALQADGLVQQRQEVKPAMVQMRNSVDTLQERPPHHQDLLLLLHLQQV